MKPLGPEDRELYCYCYTDPDLMKLIAAPLKMDAASRSFDAALRLNSSLPVRRRDWVMVEKESGSSIGLLSLVGCKTKPEAINADLGAIILDEFQGRGYSLEGTGALVDAAFHVSHINSVHTYHLAENAAVGRVMAKLGFSCTIEIHDGIENYHWQLQRPNWQPGKYVLDSNALQSQPGSDNVVDFGKAG